MGPDGWCMGVFEAYEHPPGTPPIAEKMSCILLLSQLSLPGWVWVCALPPPPAHCACSPTPHCRSYERHQHLVAQLLLCPPSHIPTPTLAHTAHSNTHAAMSGIRIWWPRCSATRR